MPGLDDSRASIFQRTTAASLLSWQVQTTTATETSPDVSQRLRHEGQLYDLVGKTRTGYGASMTRDHAPCPVPAGYAIMGGRGSWEPAIAPPGRSHHDPMVQITRRSAKIVQRRRRRARALPDMVPPSGCPSRAAELIVRHSQRSFGVLGWEFSGACSGEKLGTFFIAPCGRNVRCRTEGAYGCLRSRRGGDKIDKIASEPAITAIRRPAVSPR